MRISALQPWK